MRGAGQVGVLLVGLCQVGQAILGGGVRERLWEGLVGGPPQDVTFLESCCRSGFGQGVEWGPGVAGMW